MSAAEDPFAPIPPRAAPRAGLAPVLILLSLSSVIAITLTAVRVAYTGGGAYISLIWNLFLAWIPMWASIPIARGRPDTRRSWTAALICIATWLLFFPNSPYLLTDFIHLSPSHMMQHWPIHALDRVSPRGLVPPWYDVLLLFAYAWNGMMLGLTSLHLVRRAITRWTSPVWGWVMVVSAAFLCGFGVALGRFDRFNSWDIISKPGELISEILDRLVNPITHLRTSVSTVVLAAFMLVAYLSVMALVKFEKINDAEEEQAARERSTKRRGFPTVRPIEPVDGATRENATPMANASFDAG